VHHSRAPRVSHTGYSSEPTPAHSYTVQKIRRCFKWLSFRVSHHRSGRGVRVGKDWSSRCLWLHWYNQTSSNSVHGDCRVGQM